MENINLQFDPDMPIESVRNEIKKQYHIIVVRYNLPPSLMLDSVIKAVSAGMGTGESYPFKRLQQEFVDHVFAAETDTERINEAVAAFFAIWNYWPHDDMGMSPHEKLQQVANEEKKDN